MGHTPSTAENPQALQFKSFDGSRAFPEFSPPQYGWGRLFFQKWFWRGPLRACHATPGAFLIRTLLRSPVPTEALAKRLLRNPSKAALRLKNLLRTLLRRRLLHDALGMHPHSRLLSEICRASTKRTFLKRPLLETQELGLWRLGPECYTPPPTPENTLLGVGGGV